MRSSLTQLLNLSSSCRFTCSCCPPNVSRLLSTLGAYVCSASTQSEAITLAVHQFISCEVALNAYGFPGGKLVIETGFPHQGEVAIRVTGCEGRAVSLKLRVPAWAGTDWTVRPCHCLFRCDSWRSARPAATARLSATPCRSRRLTTHPPVADLGRRLLARQTDRHRRLPDSGSQRATRTRLYRPTLI